MSTAAKPGKQHGNAQRTARLLESCAATQRAPFMPAASDLTSDLRTEGRNITSGLRTVCAYEVYTARPTAKVTAATSGATSFRTQIWRKLILGLCEVLGRPWTRLSDARRKREE